MTAPASVRDVVILGGGPAGLAAARALREQGVRDVVVIEREAVAGGVPRHCGHGGFGLPEFHRWLRGAEYARRLAEAAAADIRTDTTAIGIDAGGVIRLATPAGPETIRGRCVLLALGARETPRSARLVSGTRPWGVTTTGALQQFVYLLGRRPFRQAVIVGTELVSFSNLLTMRHAGIRPVAMIEEGPRVTAPGPAGPIARYGFGVPVLLNTRLAAIHGQPQLTGVEIENGGGRARIECDGVVFSGRFLPEIGLLAGSHLRIDAGTGGPRVDQYGRCSDPVYFTAGNLLRPIEPSWIAWREGRAVARAICASLAGTLPPPQRQVQIEIGAPLRFVCPQRWSWPAPIEPALRWQLRLVRAARGTLQATAAGRQWGLRRFAAGPERRIGIRLDPSLFADAETLAIEAIET